MIRNTLFVSFHLPCKWEASRGPCPIWPIIFAVRDILSTTSLCIALKSSDKDFGRIFTHFKKWTYKWSAGIAAQTSRAAAQKKKLLGENVRINIIPNTVRRIDAPESEREGFILGVGRHYHVKGFDRLLEAFARLKTDWKLLLAGDGGPESKNLREQAKHLGIDERVIFLGKVTDMDSVYARASIFALTSRSEGFPNALCEAMAAGLVCVSYDISAGPADIITDKENGFLVQDGNIEALVSTIEMLMNQPDLRKEIGSKARLIQNELSFEKNGNKFLEFITSHIDRSC